MSLTSNGLHIRVTIRNDEEEVVPYGCGFHPYFPRRNNATITAKLPAKWIFDDELLPLAIVRNNERLQLAGGMNVSDLPSQSEYWNWTGDATVSWNDSPIAMKIRTLPPLSGAVLWVPPGQEFFCFEPVSHASNSFNCERHEAELLGVVFLEPGEVWQQNFYFDVVIARSDV